MIKLTVVVEDTIGYSSRLGMKAEHGLSMLLEFDDKKVLYDTGESDIILNNLSLVGVHPREIDAIVLSHGHYDHTGGLAAVLNHADKKMPVYAHPDIFDDKISKHADGMHFVGMKHREESLALLGAEWHFIKEPLFLYERIWLSGEVKRATSYEVGDENLLMRDGIESKISRDALRDDLSLYYQAKRGLVVISGCAHAGIINVIKQGLTITGEKYLHGIIGGIHLCVAGEEQKALTLEALQLYTPELLVTGHCTGREVEAEMWNTFPKGVMKFCHTGMSIEIQCK